MSAPFTITIDDAQVQAALTKLSRHVANLTPTMEDIGAKLGDLTEEAFQAEGPGWPALKPAHRVSEGGITGSSKRPMRRVAPASRVRRLTR